MKIINYIHTENEKKKKKLKKLIDKRDRIEGFNYIIIPLSVFPLVFAAVLGPTAYELYYLGYATSKNCLQIEIITGKYYATTNRFKQTGSHLCIGCNLQLSFSPYTSARSSDQDTYPLESK